MYIFLCVYIYIYMHMHMQIFVYLGKYLLICSVCWLILPWDLEFNSLRFQAKGQGDPVVRRRKCGPRISAELCGGTILGFRVYRVRFYS